LFADRTDKHADDERKEVSARQQLYDEKMNEYAIENKGQEGNSQTITDKFQTIDHGQVTLLSNCKNHYFHIILLTCFEQLLKFLIAMEELDKVNAPNNFSLNVVP
jgi:hypothetical protein